MTQPPAVTAPLPAPEMPQEDTEWQVLAAPGQGAQPQRPVALRRILVQVIGSIALVIVIVGVAGVVVSQRIAKKEAVHDVAQITDILAESVVQPALTDAMATNSGVASARLDALVRQGILNTQVVRVKLWNPQGLVLYSDEKRLIGQRFSLDDDARQALTAPRTEAGITDLSRPENALESAPGKLLEVYRPVWTPGGKPLLFEAYFRYDVVTDRSRDLWRGFSGVMLSSLIAVLVLLAPLLWAFYRRARSAQLHREQLMHRAVDASTAERRRIAATLHDGVVQQLAGTAFLLAGESERVAALGDEQLSGRLSEAAGVVRDNVSGMRSLLVDIYPAGLRVGGLAAALSDLGKAHTGSTARIQLAVDPEAASLLDARQQQAIFRVAQECLRNAVQHSGASNIVVRLARAGSGVRLEVSDDGRGFAPHESERAAEEGHLGLQLMADVAREVDATLSLSSGPDGTRFRMELPTG